MPGVTVRSTSVSVCCLLKIQIPINPKTFLPLMFPAKLVRRRQARMRNLAGQGLVDMVIAPAVQGSINPTSHCRIEQSRRRRPEFGRAMMMNQELI